MITTLFNKMLKFIISLFMLLPMQLHAELFFTPEERAYIESKKTIIVSSETDYEPFDFTVNGKPSGYSIEILELILKDTGLKIKYVTKDWPDLLSDLENKKIDLVHSLFTTPERQKIYHFSSAYLKSSDKFITRKDFEKINTIDQLFGITVATAKGWYHE